MKKLTTLLLLVSILTTFSLSAYADCAPKYLGEIQRLSVKVDKIKKVNKVVSGTIGGVFTAFWGVMGVIMVGPAGVIIGLEFGLLGAAPSAVTLFAVNKVNKVKMKNYFKALSVIQAAKDAPQSDTVYLQQIHEELLKKDPHLTLDDLKFEITSLNHENAFCDGDKRKNLFGFRRIKKFLKERYSQIAKKKITKPTTVI